MKVVWTKSEYESGMEAFFALQIFGVLVTILRYRLAIVPVFEITTSRITSRMRERSSVGRAKDF